MKHMTFPEFLLVRALECERHLTFPDAVFGAIWKAALDADDVFRICHYMAHPRWYRGSGQRDFAPSGVSSTGTLVLSDTGTMRLASWSCTDDSTL